MRFMLPIFIFFSFQASLAQQCINHSGLYFGSCNTPDGPRDIMIGILQPDCDNIINNEWSSNPRYYTKDFWTSYKRTNEEILRMASFYDGGNFVVLQSIITTKTEEGLESVYVYTKFIKKTSSDSISFDSTGYDISKKKSLPIVNCPNLKRGD